MNQPAGHIHDLVDCVDVALGLFGMTPLKSSIVTRGLIYPLLPSNPLTRKFAAIIDSSKPNEPPHIDVSHIFLNPNNASILSTIVTVDRHRFLIYGYLDPQLPPNCNLQEIFPHLPWQGEIVVFSLGQRVRVLARPVAARYVIHKAINVFIRAVLEARVAFAPLPAQISFTSQSVFHI